MNTKTVEELREEYVNYLRSENIQPIIAPNDSFKTKSYVSWLEQKLLTPSPERGREGKTAEENLKSFGKKDTSMQNNLSYPVYTEKEVIRLMELHAQSTSKPVEPKICELEEWNGGDETNLCDCGKGEGLCKRKNVEPKTRVTEDMIEKIARGIVDSFQNTTSINTYEMVSDGIRKGISLNQESKEREANFNFPIPSGFRIDVIVNAAISDKGMGKLIVHPDDLDTTKKIFTQSKGTE